MHDDGATTATLRAGAALRLGPVTLVPVERLALRWSRGGPGGWCLAGLAPVALVVRDAAGLRALAIDDRPVSLEALRREVPGLDLALAPA